MKKQTRRTARPTTSKTPPPELPPMPAGLPHAFKLIAHDDCTSIAASEKAARGYAPALRIIDALHGKHAEGHNGAVIEAELMKAGEAFDLDGSATTEVTAMSSFDIGFAVCWLLMMAVNGKDGAR